MIASHPLIFLIGKYYITAIHDKGIVLGVVVKFAKLKYIFVCSRLEKPIAMFNIFKNQLPFIICFEKVLARI